MAVVEVNTNGRAAVAAISRPIWAGNHNSSNKPLRSSAVARNSKHIALATTACRSNSNFR